MNYQEVINIAIKAGKKTLEIYDTDFKVEIKDDKSPVTEADLASNQVIMDGLKKLDSSIEIISEEGELIDFDKRKNLERFWLIDPLDGTKDFLKKNGEFTINIALIKNKKVIFGVVYAPVKDILYYGESGAGAYKVEAGKKEKLPIKKELNNPIQIAASRSHPCEVTEKLIEEIGTNLKKDVEKLNVGSSLKFCYLAEGKVDCYPRMVNLKEWDIGASTVIVLESECQLKNFETKGEIEFNSEKLRAPKFLGYKNSLKSVFE